MPKGLKTRTESIISDEVNIEVTSRSKYPIFFERAVDGTVSISIKAKEIKVQDNYVEQKEIIVKNNNCSCNIL